MPIFNETYASLDMRSPTDVTYRWAVETIAENRICPPLVKFLQDCRNPDGTLGWDKVKAEIHIDDFTQFQQDHPDLVPAVAGSVGTFMEMSYSPAGPLTKIFVLPDFRSNPEYDTFMSQVQSALILHYFDPSQHRNLDTLVRAAHQANPRITEHPIFAQEMKGDQYQQLNVIQQVVSGMFRPVYFYGRDLSDADTVGFMDRGPALRQKILSRAPFYMMQIVNPFKSPSYSSGIDREGLRKRNTAYAAQHRPKDLRREMDRYRKKVR